MKEHVICPDCDRAPAEPLTTMRYGGALRIFCELCQRWFALPEKTERKATGCLI